MSCGFNPDHFWRSTPREIAAHFRGARLRAEREHEAGAWLAWHIAALPRTKKFPKFDEFAGRKTPPSKKTPEEIEAMVRAWLGKK